MPATKGLFKAYENYYFVETGTYMGEGLVEALTANYKELFSIELSKHHYEDSAKRFIDNFNVKIIQGDTADMLWDVIKDLDKPITFWLDAHHSGGTTARGKYDSPLIQELKAIARHPIKTHTILIDDFKGYSKCFPELKDIVEKINKDYVITPIMGGGIGINKGEAGDIGVVQIKTKGNGGTVLRQIDLFKTYPNSNKVFVETGSCLGAGIKNALEGGFEDIYSFELAEKYYNICVGMFKENKNVHLFLGASEKLLWSVIKDINVPITFWLDAHYSCGDTAKGEYWSPIIQELKAIARHPIKTHTILIDDMRCWVDREPYFFDESTIRESITTINPKYSYRRDTSRTDIPNDVLVATVEEEK